MEQTTLNFVLGGFSCLSGFMLKVIWDSVKDLQGADKNLALRVAEIEVLVAGKYVTNERLDQVSKAIFDKLDKIDSKLDRKVDK